MPNDRRVKVKFGDREVDGVPISIDHMREEWNQYVLSDQTLLKARLIVTEVIRLVDEFTPEGDPVYVIKSANIVATECPPDLRRRV